MLDRIFDLPTHPLIVHAVVALLPLAALGAVLVALIPPARRRFGVLVAALTALPVGAIPLATRSGSHLYDRKSDVFGPDDTVEAGLMERHADLGEQLLPWALLLLGAVLLVVILPIVTGGHRDELPGAARRSGLLTRGVLLVGVAGVLVGAVVSTTLVVRIGHSGSEAVWERLDKTGPSTAR